MTSPSDRLEVLVTTWLPSSQKNKKTPWLRAGMFAPKLAERGIDLHVSGTVPEWATPWDETSRPIRAAALGSGLLKRLAQAAALPHRYDTVVVLRDLFTFTGPPWFERLYRRRADFLVFEIDDSLWAPPPEIRPPMWSPNRVVETAKSADRMICGNEFLAGWARQYCDDVVVIPTVPDASIRARTGERPEGPCRVGWYGQLNGFLFVEPYLDAIARAAEESDLAFHLLTNAAVETMYDWPRKATPHVKQWDPDTEGDDLASWDVGIMPLPDNEWTRGKCANKLLHYMAAGLATVASPTGMNSEVVVDGVTGLLVETPDEWTDALVTLARDPDMTARFGAAGRARYERHYTLEAVLPDYAAAVTPR